MGAQHTIQCVLAGNLIIDNIHLEWIGGYSTWVVGIQVIYNDSFCMAQWYGLAKNYIGQVCSVSITGELYANDNDLITVVDSMDLDRYWLQKNSLNQSLQMQKKSKGGCVAIGFIIGPDGKPSGHQVVVRYPDGAPGKIWIDALRRTRYKAAENNVERTLVYTVATRWRRRQRVRLQWIKPVYCANIWKADHR